MISLLKNFIKKNLAVELFRFHRKILSFVKKSKNEFVSIVVPNFNDSKFVIETLVSIQEQSYRNFECIIVDDGSTDDSASIVNFFCQSDSRFKLVKHHQNKGLSAARNTGIKESCGEYIIFIDSDDILAKHSILSKVVNLQDSKPYIAGVSSKIEYCREEGVKFKQKIDSIVLNNYSKYLHFSNWNTGVPFVVHSTLLKREVALKFLFDEKMVRGAEDFDFWYRILRHGYVIDHVNVTGGFYRQKSGSMLLGGFKEHFAIFEKIVAKCYTHETRSARDTPFLHEKPISYYQENYRKFDRFIRFQGYLGYQNDFFKIEESLFDHFKEIYSQRGLESFLRRVKS